MLSGGKGLKRNWGDSPGGTKSGGEGQNKATNYLLGKKKENMQRPRERPRCK